MANQKKPPLTKEAGVGGYKQFSGYVYDEFLPALRGLRGRQKYREMIDTDPIIGAMLYGISSIIRAAEWNIEPAEADSSGEYSDWLSDTIYNMPDMTWDDVIEDALSMLGFGFALQEIVIAKKEDGTVGLRKLAPRSQETIEKWDIDPNGNVLGAWQIPPGGGANVYLPISKLIHYKTKYANGNPEGRSMLRNAYRSYHFISTIMINEAIGAERDLTGLPVMYAPSDYLNATGNRAALEKIVRDIKFNDQGGLVLPSDCYPGKDGAAGSARMFELKLLTAEGGSGKVDTRKIITGHQADMARSLLADFLTLGNDGKGSYALSKDKTQLFIRAVEGLLENMAQNFDRTIIPLLWRLNGFPPEMKPCFRPGRIAPVDLAELGDFVAKLSGAGVPLNDEPTEAYLRDAGGLPPPPADGAVGDPIPDPADDQDDDPADA